MFKVGDEVYTTQHLLRKGGFRRTEDDPPEFTPVAKGTMATITGGQLRQDGMHYMVRLLDAFGKKATGLVSEKSLSLWLETDPYPEPEPFDLGLYDVMIEVFKGSSPPEASISQAGIEQTIERLEWQKGQLEKLNRGELR